jgi:hypothetical protein
VAEKPLPDRSAGAMTVSDEPGDQGNGGEHRRRHGQRRTDRHFSAGGPTVSAGRLGAMTDRRDRRRLDRDPHGR